MFNVEITLHAFQVKQYIVLLFYISWNKYFSTFSLFRLTSDGEAITQFKLISSRLNILIARSSSIFLENNLQKATDAIREHHSWTPIHIAAYLGLYEFFSQPEILR
jgi:hypothetical protein